MNTSSMRNSGKFPLKRYPSMEIVATSKTQPDQSTITTTKPVPRKAFSFQFPTSPPSNVGEEIFRFPTHPHPLSRISLPELFTCSGCKEYGAGKRLCCQQCDFQLHEFCALSLTNSALNNHPLHAQHRLDFHPKSKPVKGGMIWPKCDICGKPTKGFTFKCNACTFQMHPCCAMLSAEMNLSVHPHPLKLLPSSMTTGPDSGGFACSECKRKRSGRLYRCSVCTDYYLHAVCAKNMINGLKAGYPSNKPSKLGTAARAASVVVMEFVGGLIEGLGEGVGEAIVSNIGGVRGINNTSTSTRGITK